MASNNDMLPMPQNPKRRFDGDYIGVVEDVEDPAKLMRVRVRVKDIFTDDVPTSDLPWAVYLLPFGFRKNDGMFTPVDKGDYVWVDFPFNGDSRRPRIKGSVHYCPGSTPNFPDESCDGGKSPCTPGRTGIEPDISARTGHPCVYKQHGVCVEILEDTTFRVTQVASGSNIEISPDGKVIVHANADLYLSSKKNMETAVHGDMDDTVLGDKIQYVQGDVTENTQGRHTIAAQSDVTISSGSKITITAPAVEIN